MKIEEKKSQLRERLKKLLLLQEKLKSLYGDENYNVFVFGSYPTINFILGKSDVDMAVYTPDFDLYKKLAIKIEDFFSELNQSVDLFFIDMTMPAPAYIAPLNTSIQFTNYYPEELIHFKMKCEQNLLLIKKRMAG